MPLSEHEERILAEIEKNLAEDDPSFVQRARRSTPRDVRTRRLRWAVAGFALGFVLLLGVTFHVLLGLSGFALMLASLVVGARAVADLGADAGAAFSERFRRVLRGEQDDRSA